jgi:sulfite reductase (NADPH) flavoprotein alpha-component
MVISNKNQVIDRLHPIGVKIKNRYRLTKPGSTKETYHITLDLKDSGLTFKAGDSLGIYAQNDPRLVEHILNAMRLVGSEQLKDPRSEELISVKEFFTRKANLSRLTSSFLKLFYDYENSHDKKNHLGHLLQKENKPLLSEFLSSHDPLDLFKEYQDVDIPLQEICAQFGPLLPRFYSVASSLKASPDQVDLVVAVSTFTHSGEQRFGVASHFLCHLAEPMKTPVPLYVQPSTHFALTEDHTAPIIMIGPGTGIAPFRAFLQERLEVGSTGKNWLFFGERNQSHDFFYEDFWSHLQSENRLQLSTAFSRDQDTKTYVQHRIHEQAAEFWRWMQDGAIIYICGDAHHMAKDVAAAIEHVAKEQGNLSEEAAKAYIKALKAEKRYLLDVY